MAGGRILAKGTDKGSGFALAARIVVTASHVVRDQEAQSLQFVLGDGRTIRVEWVDQDETLEVAILHLSEDVPEMLAVGPAVEGASWRVEAQPRGNDPVLTGTITALRLRIVNAKGHEIQALQLLVYQQLGDYKGYSGSPVALESPRGVVFGLLVEQLPRRLATQPGQSKSASSVLYAVPIQNVLERFGLTELLEQYHEASSRVTSQLSADEVRAPDMLALAQEQLAKLPLDIVPNPAPLPPGSVMPLRPNSHFVGREEQLKRIAANLKAGDSTTISEVRVAASSGLGGVGKTQLASEFVHRYGRYFHSVYWVSFAERAAIRAQIAACGGTRGMNLRPDFHKLPLEERVMAVWAEWQNELPRLLVFDNCEHPDLLDRWLPPTGGSRVLVTSRRGHWDAALGVIELPLDVLDRRESVALLRKYRPDLPEDSPDLDAIAEELGDLPLALDLAGTYLDKYRHEVTPAVYLADIRRPELLEHPSLRRARGISPTKHDMDVWRTFALSYQRLDPDDETDGTAVKLLARAARLAPGEPILVGLLAWTLKPPASDDSPPQPTTTLRDALDRLADLGLLEGSGGEMLRMHRLVAAFALAEVPDDGVQAAVEAACARAAGKAHWEDQPARQEALLPHIRFVTDSAKGRVDDMAANCCTALGMSLGDLGAYDEGMPYAERAWEISVQLYGLDHRATLQRRSNIATLLEGKKYRVDARAIYKEVLEAQERVLGQEDPDVAATLNNIGASLSREDLYHETLPLYRRALRIRLGVWERTRPDDPGRRENAYEAAESHSNMGALLMDLGRYNEARPHLESALDISGGEFGKYHKRNAGTLIILGRAFRAQGDYPRAVATLMIALDIFKNVSRTAPPAAASALTNLGVVFKEWAEEDGALSSPKRPQLLETASGYLREALNGSEQMYGEDHPMTGGILRTLAGVCDARGVAEDGRRYREWAEVSSRANFQAGDADAASALNAYGTSLMGHGLYDEAHAYLERALGIREKVLEERDFDTSAILLNVGALLQLRGRHEEARSYLERALAIRVEVCGEDHPASELVRENLRLLDI